MYFSLFDRGYFDSHISTFEIYLMYPQSVLVSMEEAALIRHVYISCTSLQLQTSFKIILSYHILYTITTFPKLQDIPESLLQLARSSKINTLRIGSDLQPTDLLLRQLHILILQSLLALVQHAQVEVHEQTAQQTQHLQTNNHTQRGVVEWRLSVDVGVRSPDTSRITDRVDEGVGGGTLGRGTRQGVGDPGVDGAVLGEDEHHQEEGEVAGTEAGGGHEDDETDDADRDRVDEEPETLAQLVGHVRVAQTVDDHEDVRRDDEQQRDGVVVVQSRGQGGEEVLETGCASDAHVAEGQGVGLDVGQGELQSLDLAHAAGIVNVGLGGLNRQTAVGHPAHLGREEFPSLRKVWQDEADANADKDSHAALDNVQPLPGCQAACTPEAAQNTGRDEVTESATDQRTGVEDTHTEGQFLAGVPLGQVEQHTGEEGCLCSKRQ